MRQLAIIESARVNEADNLLVAANWSTAFALLAGQDRDERIAVEADQPHIRFWRARSGALATS
jgi:hypothetical protein